MNSSKLIAFEIFHRRSWTISKTLMLRTFSNKSLQICRKSKEIYRDSFLNTSLRFPFYHHTMPEYFLTQIWCVTTYVAYTLAVIPCVTFFINCFFLIEAGSKHFKSFYMEMDRLALENGDAGLASAMIKKQLIDSINLHVELIGYF